MSTDWIKIDIPVIRGFLGRQEYRRRLVQARSEAERVKHLADNIYNMNIHLCNQLQIAKQNDTKIPPSKPASRSFCISITIFTKWHFEGMGGGGGSYLIC